MSMPPRGPWTLWLAVVLLGALTLGAALSRPHVEGDTVTLLDSTTRLRACLQRGEARCPAVSTSSLQQLAMVAVAQQGGLPDGAIVSLLALLSAVAVWGLALLAATGLEPRNRPLGVALVATSPLVYYARSTFGEALAAVSLALLVLLWRAWRTPLWLLAAAGAWAALGKDTLWPFVIGLALLAAWLDRDDGRSGIARRLGAVAAGAGLGAAIFATLHLYRVGVPYNTEYLAHPEFFLSSGLDVGSAFLGHWLSPAAGLVWFWPVAVAVLVTSGRVGAAAAALLAVQAAGLSTWWSPFGWVAWGDRLTYPLVAAVTLLCLTRRADGRPPGRLPVVVWIVAAAGVVCGTALLVDNAALGVFFAPDARFPGPPTIQADVALYRRFLRHLTWRHWFDLRTLVAPLATPAGLVALGLQVAIAGSLRRAWSAGDDRRRGY